MGEVSCFLSPLSLWSLSTILNEEKKIIFLLFTCKSQFSNGFQSTRGLKALLHSCCCICCCWKLKLAEIIIPNVWRECVLGTAWCILFLQGVWSHSTKQQQYQKFRVDVGFCFVVPPSHPHTGPWQCEGLQKTACIINVYFRASDRIDVCT